MNAYIWGGPEHGKVIELRDRQYDYQVHLARHSLSVKWPDVIPPIADVPLPRNRLVRWLVNKLAPGLLGLVPKLLHTLKQQEQQLTSFETFTYRLELWRIGSRELVLLLPLQQKAELPREVAQGLMYAYPKCVRPIDYLAEAPSR